VSAKGFKLAWLKRLHGSDLPIRTEFVLRTIADYADADGRNAYPGEERLAADCRMSVRTIQRHIAILLETGWLVEESRGRKSNNGDARFSAYRLATPADLADDIEASQDAADELETVDHTDTLEDATDAPRGQSAPIAIPLTAYPDPHGKCPDCGAPIGHDYVTVAGVNYCFYDGRTREEIASGEGLIKSGKYERLVTGG
jgi:hypothetical protein